MTAPPDLSVTLSGISFLYGEDLAGLLETARIADQCGIDQLVVPDHVVMGKHTERYPYGRFPMPLEEPWPEPLILLAVMAGATRRVRLGTGVLISPLRPAVLLAKQLATLDQLSGGRLEIGVGTGWQREEYLACGVPWEERWQRLEDQLRACQLLWREAPASFHSPTVSFEEIWCLPRPVQEGGVPLWFGVRPTPGNCRRIAAFGCGWMPMDTSPEAIREGIARIRLAFEAAGRRFEGFRVRAHAPVVQARDRRVDLPRTLAGVAQLQEAGATDISFALPRFVRRREEIPAFFEQLVKWKRAG